MWSRMLRNLSVEEGKKLVAKAIRAGIFNDLGSGEPLNIETHLFPQTVKSLRLPDWCACKCHDACASSVAILMTAPSSFMACVWTDSTPLIFEDIRCMAACSLLDTAQVAMWMQLGSTSATIVKECQSQRTSGLSYHENVWKCKVFNVFNQAYRVSPPPYSLISPMLVYVGHATMYSY